jgi:hypothetical protein
MDFDVLSLLYRVFEAYLVELVDATMSLTSFQYFLHILPVTVHINDGQPRIHANHKNLHFLPNLNSTLLASLQMFQLKHCSLSPFHAGHQSLDLQVFLAQIILHLFRVHQVE